MSLNPNLLRQRTPKHLALAAGGGSAALLAGALFFQSIGYPPCDLCILQRWPHLGAAAVAVTIAAVGFRRALAWLGLAMAMIAFALAVHHSGVEQGWWAGPAACSGGVGDLANVTPQELLARIRGAEVVRCDQPVWMFLGLSMAAWNAILSAVLAGVWALSLRRRAG